MAVKRQKRRISDKGFGPKQGGDNVYIGKLSSRKKRTAKARIMVGFGYNSLPKKYTAQILRILTNIHLNPTEKKIAQLKVLAEARSKTKSGKISRELTRIIEEMQKDIKALPKMPAKRGL